MVGENVVFTLRCKVFLQLEQNHQPEMRLLPSIHLSRLQRADSFTVNLKGETKTDWMKTIMSLELT